MRIGFVSSYPPIECGIRTYTQYLTDAMRQLPTEVYVVSHAGASGPNVFPSFDYEDADLAERAFRAMVRLTPDVVHIQHEFGLFGKHQGRARVHRRLTYCTGTVIQPICLPISTDPMSGTCTWRTDSSSRMH